MNTMGLISGLVCEHKLPIPFDDFTDDEEKDFKDVKWDELIFYTSSFFDGALGHYGLSNYTISEDGQFYKNEIEIEFVKGKDGEIETKEKDSGLERLDFTGEIFFGTEILGDNYDYTITFRALFFKGDLKELESDEWNKKSNKKRKEMTNDLYEEAVASIAEAQKMIAKSNK